MANIENLTHGIIKTAANRKKSAPPFEYVEFGDLNKWESEVERVKGRFGGTGTAPKGASGEIETKGGVGVWEAVPRPYLPSLVVWRGPKEPYQHKIPILFDGWHDHDSTDVEEAVRKIEELTNVMPFGAETLKEPVQLYLDGAGTIPHDYTSESGGGPSWVIYGEPEWGERTRDQVSGKLIRQAVTITFAVYVPNIEISTETSPHPLDYTIYVVKKAESWETIAAHVFHRASWGTRLAHFNGKNQNGKNEVPPGHVKIPDTSIQKQWNTETRR